MKFLKNLKTLLTGACVAFTVLALGLILIKLAIDKSLNGGIIDTVRFLCLFPCGLALSAAQMIYRQTHLPRWGRMLLHYLISLLSLFLFLWLPVNAGAGAAKNLILLCMLTLLYWGGFLIGISVRKRYQSFREE